MKKSLRIGAITVLVGVAVTIATACSAPTPAPTPQPPSPVPQQPQAQTAKNLILQADIVTGSGGTLKRDAVCVLSSQYKRGNQVVWRAKVIDPATGKPMNETALKAVVVKLPDGQTFEMKYGDHPKNGPTDQFWATSWVIPDNYATGSFPYKITATANDGRTGEFTEFNVNLSLLTIVP